MAALRDETNESPDEALRLLSVAKGSGGALLQGSEVNVGINGFGRIGRAVLRVVLGREGAAGAPVRVRAINAPGKSAVSHCDPCKRPSITPLLGPGNKQTHALACLLRRWSWRRSTFVTR